jgi:hypothetical protein
MSEATLKIPVLCSRCESRRAELEAAGWTYVSCKKAADQSGTPPGEEACVLRMTRAAADV